MIDAVLEVNDLVAGYDPDFNPSRHEHSNQKKCFNSRNWSQWRWEIYLDQSCCWGSSKLFRGMEINWRQISQAFVRIN